MWIEIFSCFDSERMLSDALDALSILRWSHLMVISSPKNRLMAMFFTCFDLERILADAVRNLSMARNIKEAIGQIAINVKLSIFVFHQISQTSHVFASISRVCYVQFLHDLSKCRFCEWKHCPWNCSDFFLCQLVWTILSKWRLLFWAL